MTVGYLVHGPAAGQAEKKAAEEQRKLYQTALQHYQTNILGKGGTYTLGANQFKGAIGTLKGGYNQALSALSSSGRSAKQQIVTGGQEAQAAALQSLQSRGLYGTTAYDNAALGISSSTSTQLAEVDEQIGQMTAGILGQKAQAVSSAKQAYGAYLGTVGTSTHENYINLLRDKPRQFNYQGYLAAGSGKVANDFVKLFGSIFGMAAGGG